MLYEQQNQLSFINNVKKEQANNFTHSNSIRSVNNILLKDYEKNISCNPPPKTNKQTLKIIKHSISI